eukprot:SAG11_NODE_2289_length_3558_cov_7.072275_1_plen_608_part_00
MQWRGGGGGSAVARQSSLDTLAAAAAEWEAALLSGSTSPSRLSPRWPMLTPQPRHASQRHMATAPSPSPPAPSPRSRSGAAGQSRSIEQLRALWRAEDEIGAAAMPLSGSGPIHGGGGSGGGGGGTVQPDIFARRQLAAELSVWPGAAAVGAAAARHGAVAKSCCWRVHWRESAGWWVSVALAALLCAAAAAATVLCHGATGVPVSAASAAQPHTVLDTAAPAEAAGAITAARGVVASAAAATSANTDLESPEVFDKVGLPTAIAAATVAATLCACHRAGQRLAMDGTAQRPASVLPAPASVEREAPLLPPLPKPLAEASRRLRPVTSPDATPPAPVTPEEAYACLQATLSDALRTAEEETRATAAAVALGPRRRSRTPRPATAERATPLRSRVAVPMQSGDELGGERGEGERVAALCLGVDSLEEAQTVTRALALTVTQAAVESEFVAVLAPAEEREAVATVGIELEREVAQMWRDAKIPALEETGGEVVHAVHALDETQVETTQAAETLRETESAIGMEAEAQAQPVEAEAQLHRLGHHLQRSQQRAAESARARAAASLRLDRVRRAALRSISDCNEATKLPQHLTTSAAVLAHAEADGKKMLYI